ncbi:hypothetical protein HLH33_10125 [Gluconacetobacter diazotrophicus]|uniref:Uncharacterized protein n=1 Tax=Gluconacetobacter diazotrophicus TaxID=33996 RepID=A0A7W4I545_GLUDI|nr:hypothetical protein [Gluconacetobacter diazotrophicus]MBB2156662.1 hypothetical protein [Gluconacetobacter diazotrophicus]
MMFDDFIVDLKTHGISEDTVCVHSRRGGDTPGYESKWKIYYRSKKYPHVGVLTTFESDTEICRDGDAKFRAEIENYTTLRGAGYDVPNIYGETIVIDDILNDEKSKAALIVEHIDGVGPFKPRTEVRTIILALRNKGFDKEIYIDAWGKLSTCASEIAPSDLQVMFTTDGRIVTIDPEHIGGPLDLPAFN